MIVSILIFALFLTFKVCGVQNKLCQRRFNVNLKLCHHKESWYYCIGKLQRLWRDRIDMQLEPSLLNINSIYTVSIG